MVARRRTVSHPLWIIDRSRVLREEGDRENLEEQLKPFLDEPRPK